jgi:Zn-dependent M28 family amino/carboxypeptidase
VLQRMLGATSARRPLVLEVAEDHPYWLAAKGAHKVLGGRRAAARPVFLVRSSLLPPGPTDDREPAWTATYTVAAAEKAEVPLRNVVALLPGTTKKDEFVVVSAHYDHIGTGIPVDGDAVYNGADDDATGTTAVLLLAEAMQKQPPPQRSVLFVCFSAEERGLRGSAAFCERPPVPGDRIVANLNLEMLGRPEPGKAGMAWITGAGHSDFATIVGAALAKGGVERIDFPMADRLFTASDNFSFVRHGVVAHSLSAGSLHADYHQPSDEVELLDIPHMTKVIQALVHVVRDLADRDVPPQWTDSGKKLVDRLRK